MILAPEFRKNTPWRIKGEHATLPVAMSLRSCRVTVCDMEGVKNGVEVAGGELPLYSVVLFPWHNAGAW
jgi:hypothetical protein